jgi:hypothetical protein
MLSNNGVDYEPLYEDEGNKCEESFPSTTIGEVRASTRARAFLRSCWKNLKQAAYLGK